MHKPTLLVFSLLLLSTSVCLMGMEGDDRLPRYTALPSVLGMSPKPQRLVDSPGMRSKIEYKRKNILALITEIQAGYRLPEPLERGVFRDARMCGLEGQLKEAIADQQKPDSEKQDEE